MEKVTVKFEKPVTARCGKIRPMYLAGDW